MILYSEIDTRELLKLIPIEDAVNYYGRDKILDEIGVESVKDWLEDTEEWETNGKQKHHEEISRNSK